MKMNYCKCCDRYISRTQWNTHRESKPCLKNHTNKCKDDNHRIIPKDTTQEEEK